MVLPAVAARPGGASPFHPPLPLDRVWEVHLAGGFAHRGYWLDAHSGLPDADLLHLAERILPRLPALRAVLFEVTASAAPQLDVHQLRDLLLRVSDRWPRRPGDLPVIPLPTVPRRPDREIAEVTSPEGAALSPDDWERTLGSLAIGRNPDTLLARQLSADPAIPLLRELVTEFRASALVGTLVYTMRLLFLTLRESGVRELIDAYTRHHPPYLFSSQEAFQFGEYLRRVRPEVPWLTDVLELDLGIARVRLNGSPCTVSLETDPTDLLTDLGAGRLPVAPRRGSFRVQLVDE